jgi:hypothetical protein
VSIQFYRIYQPALKTIIKNGSFFGIFEFDPAVLLFGGKLYFFWNENTAAYRAEKRTTHIFCGVPEQPQFFAIS